jgi:hypothetical protein
MKINVHHISGNWVHGIYQLTAVVLSSFDARTQVGLEASVKDAVSSHYGT